MVYPNLETEKSENRAQRFMTQDNGTMINIAIRD